MRIKFSIRYCALGFCFNHHSTVMYIYPLPFVRIAIGAV